MAQRTAVALLVSFGLLALGSGRALARSPGTYLDYGAGQQSCGAWTSHFSSPGYHTVDQQWLLGFVSGTSYEGTVLSETDGNAITAWVDNYCAQHPLDNVATAAGRLVDVLVRRAGEGR